MERAKYHGLVLPCPKTGSRSRCPLELPPAVPVAMISRPPSIHLLACGLALKNSVFVFTTVIGLQDRSLELNKLNSQGLIALTLVLG